MHRKLKSKNAANRQQSIAYSCIIVYLYKWNDETIISALFSKIIPYSVICFSGQKAKNLVLNYILGLESSSRYSPAWYLSFLILNQLPAVVVFWSPNTKTFYWCWVLIIIHFVLRNRWVSLDLINRIFSFPINKTSALKISVCSILYGAINFLVTFIWNYLSAEISAV